MSNQRRSRSTDLETERREKDRGRMLLVGPITSQDDDSLALVDTLQVGAPMFEMPDRDEINQERKTLCGQLSARTDYVSITSPMNDRTTQPSYKRQGTSFWTNLDGSCTLDTVGDWIQYDKLVVD